jgi:hypothetical protein
MPSKARSLGKAVSSGNPLATGVINASDITGLNANALSDVDTITQAPQNNQALVWSSGVSNWVPGTINSGVTSVNGLAGAITGLATLASPTFTTPSADTLTLTGELRGPSSFIIDPAVIGDDTGTVRIRGNLQIDGTTTTVNSTTLNIADLNITLANGAANATAANGAGITIAGPTTPATILYTSSNDSFTINKSIRITSTESNNSDTSGALVVSGGVAVTGTLRVVNGSLNMANTTNGIYCHYFGTVTNGNITVYNAYNNTDPRIIFYGGTGSNLTYHTANLALYPGTNLGLDLGMSNNRWNNLYVANANLSGTLTESSSIVYKENIQPITNALELVTQLTGVTYDRIDGSAKNRAGLIKEAVEQVLPNIVHRDGIQYTNIIAYLVESIKELKREIDVLRGV